MKTLFALALLLLPLAALAQETPVEISAAHSLEWNRSAKTYTAREKATVRQGSLDLASDTIVADYHDDKGGIDVWRITASGNVTVSSAPYTATGDKAVYDVAAETAILTGSALKIATPTEHLTAQKSITFSMKDNKLSAIGKATAVRGTDSLAADRLDAFFKKGADGKMTLEKIVSDTAVTIKTARETVTGDKGLYDVAAGKATLTGNIRIQQGQSLIEGTRAEVDLKTGISQLFATDNKATNGRVKGVFFPKKKQQ